MSDLISIQAAIKILRDWGNPNTPFMDREQAMKMAIDALEAQPQWIPCSERLPEVSKDPYYIDEIDGEMLFESERVLVFGKNEDGYDYAVATHIYSTAMGNEWSGAYDAAEIELTQILAWMPLPKPYGGESE